MCVYVFVFLFNLQLDSLSALKIYTVFCFA